ncbi:MAG: exo-alpha-sialidase [Clostridia bacterium]|nr:exo-alpha-sialidase [Clostridia bacterium]
MKKENLSIKPPIKKGNTIIPANFSADLSSGSLKTVFGNKFGVGILWNSSNLLFSVEGKEIEKITLTIDGTKKEATSTSNITNLLFSLDGPGISIHDAKQYIPFSLGVEAKGEVSTVDGYAYLCEYEPIFSLCDNDLPEVVKKAHVNPEANFDEMDLGIEKKDASIHIFDKYNDSANNYMHTDAIVSYSGISGLEEAKKIMFDADITINSIPMIDYSTITGINGGYGLTFQLSGGNGKDSLIIGVQKNENHIFLYCNRGFVAIDKTINRAYGEKFHLTVVWNKGSSVEAYIDGALLSKIYYPTTCRQGYDDNTLKISWSRCHHAPKSHADDFDAIVENLTVCSDHTETVFDKVTVTDILEDKNAVSSSADRIYIAPEKLALFGKLTNEKYGTTADVIWESSDKALLSDEGVFDFPAESGKAVTLNMTLASKKYIEYQQSFTFFVKGKAPKNSALVLQNDLNPFTSELKCEDNTIDLGSCFTSIGYDMGEIARINNISVTSHASIGFINKNHISLFASDDNKTYTYIPEYSVLKRGNKLYFYNFDVTARYIKINTTTGAVGETNKNIIGSLQEMIKASFVSSPLLSSGNFEKKTSVRISNTSDKPVYDKVASYTLADLGICPCDLKEDASDIRFIYGDKCLPIYFHNGKIFVRIFEIAPLSEITVDILYKNSSAENIFDGNEVFEAQYGIKHAKNNPDGHWVNSVATMPNGDLLKIHDGPSTNGVGSLAYRRSTDGGLTWSDAIKIETSDNVNHHGGFIVDKKTGKVFYIGFYLRFKGYAQRTEFLYDEDKSYCEPRIFLSEDNGYTWSEPMRISGENIPIYLLSYSNGIALKDADGDGPNVDYVFTTGMMWDQNKLSFCDAIYYSKDGGKTWLMSDTKVNYTFGGDNNTFEGGMSEETVWEQEDGTLVLYARCELKHIKHFAIARSYDHGVTWVAPKEDDLSNVYATNTQPIIESLDGMPVLMWGGQNGFGAKSHYRLPLSLAVSYDDANTFRGHVDASFQNLIASVDRSIIGNLHTNPDMTFCKYRGIDMCYLVSTHHQLYIMNVKDHLFKTKGAFDSFENGVEAEGWMCQKGKPQISNLGATDGKYAMLLEGLSNPSRSLHHIEKGYVEFDCFVENIGDHVSFELQTAYHDGEGFTAPIRLMANGDGELFCFTAEGTGAYRPLGLKLEAGHNTIRFDFDAEAAYASLTVNGIGADMTYIDGIGDVICFATFFTTNGTKIAIDRFTAENYN